MFNVKKLAPGLYVALLAALLIPLGYVTVTKTFYETAIAINKSHQTFNEIENKFEHAYAYEIGFIKKKTVGCMYKKYTGIQNDFVTVSYFPMKVEITKDENRDKKYFNQCLKNLIASADSVLDLKARKKLLQKFELDVLSHKELTALIKTH